MLASVIPTWKTGRNSSMWPWCSRTVIATVRDGERATPAPEPAATKEINYERCPDCAGTCAGATCPICGVQARPAETYARLSVCAEQGVVPIDLADWILRKYA